MDILKLFQLRRTLTECARGRYAVTYAQLLVTAMRKTFSQTIKNQKKAFIVAMNSLFTQTRIKIEEFATLASVNSPGVELTHLPVKL